LPNRERGHGVGICDSPLEGQHRQRSRKRLALGGPDRLLQVGGFYDLDSLSVIGHS
jgi:hypothetical protein